MRLNIPAAIIAATSLFAMPASAQTITQGQQLAGSEAAVGIFHKLLDAGQYGTIYTGGTPGFREDETQAAFMANMVGYHNQMGNFVSATQVGDVVTDNSAGNFTTLTYNVTYAKGTATESFVFQLVGTQLEIAYFSTKNLVMNGH